jgi:hypothetical protein
MKSIIYILAVTGLLSVGAVTAKNIIATDHNHDTVSSTVIDHSGRTNSDGCHNDYKKGTYHCH